MQICISKEFIPHSKFDGPELAGLLSYGGYCRDDKGAKHFVPRFMPRRDELNSLLANEPSLDEYAKRLRNRTFCLWDECLFSNIMPEYETLDLTRTFEDCMRDLNKMPLTIRGESVRKKTVKDSLSNEGGKVCKVCTSKKHKKQATGKTTSVKQARSTGGQSNAVFGGEPHATVVIGRNKEATRQRPPKTISSNDKHPAAKRRQ